MAARAESDRILGTNQFADLVRPGRRARAILTGMSHSLAAMDELWFASSILFIHSLGVPGSCFHLGRFPADCWGCIQKVLAFGGLSLAYDAHRATREWESPGENAFPGLPVAGGRAMISSLFCLWWSFAAARTNATVSSAVLQKKSAVLQSLRAVLQRSPCCTAKSHITSSEEKRAKRPLMCGGSLRRPPPVSEE